MSPNEIHIWIVFPEQIQETARLERYRRILSDEERGRESRFHFEHDRHRYLLTRALIRITLSRYIGINPDECRFTVDQFGRPHCVNEALRAARLSFNVSHTRGMILLGVTQDTDLGVDVEASIACPASLSLAEYYFSARETAALRALPVSQQINGFLEYWTLKEAYAKARGLGLALPLSSFGFRLEQEGKIGFWAQSDVDCRAEDWRFWQFSISAKYIVAICARRSSRADFRLLARTTIPGERESETPLSVTRQS